MASLNRDNFGDFYNGVPEPTKDFIPDRLSLNLDSYEMYIPPASECVASVDDVMGFWEAPEAEEDDEDDEDDDQRCWLPPTVNDESLFRTPEPQVGLREPPISPFWRRESESGGGCIDPSSLQLPADTTSSPQSSHLKQRKQRMPRAVRNQPVSPIAPNPRPLEGSEDTAPDVAMVNAPVEHEDVEDTAKPALAVVSPQADKMEQHSASAVSSPESVKSIPTSPEMDSSDVYDVSSESENDPEVQMPIRGTRSIGSHGRKMAQQHRCDKLLHNGRPCMKSFTRPYDLARHQDTIHARERKVYKCDKCEDNSKTFSRMDALSRHMRIKHPHGR